MKFILVNKYIKKEVWKIKKSFFVLTAIVMFIVSGCSISIGNKKEEEVKDLKLQLLKVDEEAGVTFDNNSIYRDLEDWIKSDPKMGIPNDFSIYPLDIIKYEDGSSALLLLGVNRLDVPIKNMNFEFTIGKKDGEYMWEGMEVDLPEEQIGILEPDSSVPVILDITPEEEELYLELTDDNVDMKIDNFDMDVVE